MMKAERTGPDAVSPNSSGTGCAPNVPTPAAGPNYQQALERLADMCEQCRRTVDYEVHDGVIEYLTGALMNLESALQVLGDRAPATAKERFDKAIQLLRNGITAARSLMQSIRPSLLDDFDLIGAVDRLVYESRKKTSTTIEWSHDGSLGRLAPPLENALFRMVQEGLGNALRHSGSNKVRVTLAGNNEYVCLTVEDWGCGFELGKVAKSCFGLHGIGERARMLGGRAIIDSVPGRGTHITVELPLVTIPT